MGFSTRVPIRCTVCDNVVAVVSGPVLFKGAVMTGNGLLKPEEVAKRISDYGDVCCTSCNVIRSRSVPIIQPKGK